MLNSLQNYLKSLPLARGKSDVDNIGVCVSWRGAAENGGETNLALRKLVYLLPLEGVRGEELVTYSNVINIGLPIGEGLGGSLGGRWMVVGWGLFLTAKL